MSALHCSVLGSFSSRLATTSRRRVAARAGTERPVFQLHSRQDLTLEDVRDAYEVCSLIPEPSERQQCYAVFGLDSQRMATYYESVLQLEDQLSAARNGCEAANSMDDDEYTQPGWLPFKWMPNH